MTVYAIAAFALAFAITAAVGPSIILKLRKMKCGGTVLEIGPKWHLKKGNIPVMGGLMFIFSSIVASLIVLLAAPYFSMHWDIGDVAAFEGNRYWIGMLAALGFAMVCGVVGFLDDFEKIKKKRNLGLTALQKLLLQCAAAVVFILVLRQFGLVTPTIIVPFWNVTWTWPWWAYVPFMMFVIVGTVNSANLTDGIDGLAGGVTLIITLFFAAAALFLFEQSPSGTLIGVAILAAAVAGGLAGFLLFNFSPAKVWMGDTGSLFLGAIVCGLAFAIDLPLILVPVGVIYIIETLSDIIQIGYFKLTHGKRVFKMAPIHHHFEMCGWSEKKIDMTAYGITLVCCALAFWGVTML